MIRVLTLLLLMLLPASLMAQLPFTFDPIKEDLHPGLQQLLDSAALEGVVLVFDPLTNILYSNDLERAGKGSLPASTFKIPNSLIALETGIVKNESTLFAWDGNKRSLQQWEQDMDFRQAFHLSCVPCYQQIARSIGPQRMNHWLELFSYGKMDVHSHNIDTFWLQGESEISPLQQLIFLVNLYFGNLPVSENTYRIIRQLMVIEENDNWKLSGKTGWAIRQGNNTGWFVGYLEKKEQVFFVVSCVEPAEAFNMQMFHLVRQAVSMEAFRLLKLLD